MKARCFSSLLLLAAAACGDSDGSDGRSSLAITEDEPSGANCPFGGVSITTGLDRNGNGRLEESESPSTRYVCNGIGGSDGDGGVSALQPVVVTSDAPASECPAGGVQITVGFDRNGDGDIEDTGEVNGQPRYLCSGTGGQLTQAGAEPPGANCEAGGVRIESGDDANQNGKLDAEEVLATSYACTDPTVTNGANPVVVSAASDATYMSSGITGPGPGATITLHSAEITAPVSGVVLAIASTTAYCDGSDPGAAMPSNCAPAPFSTVANFTIAQQNVGTGLGSSGTAELVFLTSGTEIPLTTTEVFGVTPGTYTFNALGLAGINEATPGGGVPGNVGANVLYGPTELTLVFIPN